jgi:hypothetical protein
LGVDAVAVATLRDRFKSVSALTKLILSNSSRKAAFSPPNC